MSLNRFFLTFKNEDGNFPYSSIMIAKHSGEGWYCTTTEEELNQWFDETNIPPYDLVAHLEHELD